MRRQSDLLLSQGAIQFRKQNVLKIKFFSLNCENLFLMSDEPLSASDLLLDEESWQKKSTSIIANKPLAKTKWLRDIILQESPDICLLSEVGGLESLQTFNRLFLNDLYTPMLIEGNSDRHIDVGYLVRKGLPFYFDILTNKNRSINFNYPREIELASKSGRRLQSHKFSRDVAELICFKQSPDRPFFISLLTHLKSRLDPEGLDPNGFLRRRAELEACVSLYLEINKKHSGLVPVLLAGDFNGNASAWNTEREFTALYDQTDLQDICALAQIAPPQNFTFYQASRGAITEGKQIDFCFASPSLQKLIDRKSIQVYRYKDLQGNSLSPPQHFEDKLLLPSDHYPLTFEIEIDAH